MKIHRHPKPFRGADLLLSAQALRVPPRISRRSTSWICMSVFTIQSLFLLTLLNGSMLMVDIVEGGTILPSSVAAAFRTCKALHRNCRRHIADKINGEFEISSCKSSLNSNAHASFRQRLMYLHRGLVSSAITSFRDRNNYAAAANDVDADESYGSWIEFDDDEDEDMMAIDGCNDEENYESDFDDDDYDRFCSDQEINKGSSWWSKYTTRREKRSNRKEGHQRQPESSELNNGSIYENKGTIEGEEQEGEEEEHPMRTDEWLVTIHLSPLLFPTTIPQEASLFPQAKTSNATITTFPNCKDNSKTMKRRNQILRFARNGYVILLEDEENDCQHPQNSVIEFVDSNRFCNIQKQPSKQRITKVGKWRMDATGISWDIPVRIPIVASQDLTSINTRPISYMKDLNDMEIDYESLAGSGNSKGEQILSGQDNSHSSLSSTAIIKRTTLHYHADLHLNKFQKAPRMFRGVVTRDRFQTITTSFRPTNATISELLPSFEEQQQPWWCTALPRHVLRPVIATFTAEGIGKDTVDTSYKNRGFGLNASGNSIKNSANNDDKFRK